MKRFFLSLVFTSLLFVSCSNNDDSPITPDPVTPTPTVTLDNPINDFVWKAMNSWYNWQPQVSNLADSKDDNQDTYYTFLNGYSNPSDLLYNLCYKHKNIVGSDNAVDRFTWFITDYNEQNASFRGVNDSYGFEFDLARLCSDCDEVIGYVTYVVPNSPAADANLKRGDIFYKFDNTELTLNSYTVVNNYYYNENISLDFATISNGIITATGTSADLTLREITENPVHYSNVITAANGTKVGYLVYNGFKYTFHEELNNVFADFKNEGIQELVLDLRYNGGGSVLTSAFLASMIHGGAGTNEVFAQLTYNNKHSDESGAYPFFNDAYVYDKEGEYSHNVAINRLNTLSRIYIITSGSTASASEMIINGLSPYLSDVVLIGTTTYGKNVGSITLYDSPDFTKNTTVNSSHTNAMQPIVFQIYNKNNESDYTQGFIPDHEVVEYISDMKPFGNTDEPLLKTALDLISGVAKSSRASKGQSLGQKPIFSSLEKKKFSKEMYIIPNE